MQDEEALDDVAAAPGRNADAIEEIRAAVSRDVLALYDVYSYRHAAVILRHAYPDALCEIERALLAFRITTVDIGMPGGNESVIPKRLSAILRADGWRETRIQGDLSVRITETGEQVLEDGRLRKFALPECAPVVLDNYIDGHKIDFVKGRVALDLEWNSKDQTYDRDLYAFRMFHECGIISVAVLITRSEQLNQLFNVVPKRRKDGSLELDEAGNPVACKNKYGASTTWMGKLLYRLNAGRHGGCPVLVFGIRPDVVSDWPMSAGVML